MLFFIIFIGFFVNFVSSKNVVLIIADDLDSVLDGMTPMTNTTKLIGDEGAIFDNCFAAVPICCPNRASILTGRYQHNHKTYNNSISGNCNGADWRSIHEPQTFAALLKKKANYKTFYAGKYLNTYGKPETGGSRVPIGWDKWYGLHGNSKYYDYTLSINGADKKFGNSVQEYLTDVVRKYATDFIKDQAKDEPFLMIVAPPAPHEPWLPAARHAGTFKNIKAKRTKNFNTSSQKDKHWLVRMGQSPLPSKVVQSLDVIYRKRWESLLAVDEMVLDIYNTLQSKNLIDDTYIIFTSDNGFHIGQFSMPYDKRQPYETDIRIPLMIRGPAFVRGTHITSAVSSVDLFATIMELAGIEAPSDGTSLLNKAEDRTVFIEYKGERSIKPETSGCPSDVDPELSNCSKDFACKCQDVANNTYACVRRVSKDFNNVFCTFNDDENFVEYYDLKEDEYQMHNEGFQINSGMRHRFRKRVKKMSICKGRTCIAIPPTAKNNPFTS